MIGRATALALRALSAAATTTQAQAPTQSFAQTSSSLMQMARRAFATNSTDIFNTHRDTPENNADTPFEISAVSERLLHAPLARGPLLTAWGITGDVQENMKKLDKIGGAK